MEHGIFDSTPDMAFAIKWHGEWNHSYFEPLNTVYTGLAQA